MKNIILRGKGQLIGGYCNVDLENDFFESYENIQCIVVNNDGWSPVRGKFKDNTLKIEAQSMYANNVVDWYVIADKKEDRNL